MITEGKVRITCPGAMAKEGEEPRTLSELEVLVIKQWYDAKLMGGKFQEAVTGEAEKPKKVASIARRGVAVERAPDSERDEQGESEDGAFSPDAVVERGKSSGSRRPAKRARVSEAVSAKAAARSPPERVQSSGSRRPAKRSSPDAGVERWRPARRARDDPTFKMIKFCKGFYKGFCECCQSGGISLGFSGERSPQHWFPRGHRDLVSWSLT